MKSTVLFYRIFLVLLLLNVTLVTNGQQFLMEMMDTSTEVGRGLFYLYKKFDRVQIGGYIQTQYQVAQEKGTKTYNGGDFPAQSDNRFMIRRGRIRFDYIHFVEGNQPSVQFVFQFEGSERGVFIRDFYGRIFENKWHAFSLSAGMFARPFGYEVNLSSAERESPERGRMSQILMKTERDLGAMVSFDPRGKHHPLRFFKVDLGIFNGQGLTAPGEFDNYKDKIVRLSLKPYPLSSSVRLSAGLSYFNGGLYQNSRFINRMGTGSNKEIFMVDSSFSNIGMKAPRIYKGGDAQLRWKTAWGNTELRAEYAWGTQTSTATNPETPASLLNEPYYIRNFDGGFFYLLQHLVNTHHQVGFKFDWYDPNTKLNGRLIGLPSSNTNLADIRFSTFSFGYNKYFHENLKVLLWYEIVRNEHTVLNGFTEDVRDNVFTCRLQFRF